MGYVLNVGPELEFFYFKDQHSTEVLDHGGYFDLTSLDYASDLRRDTVLTLEKMGIPVEYSHHENGPSQHEIDLRFTDALSMADAVMTYKLVVKEIAMKHGVYASFMPKPLADAPGSGMHVHQSLFDLDGNNAFFDPNDPLHHQSVRELLQAPGFRRRGAHLHFLGSPQPLDACAHPRISSESRSRVSRGAAQPRPGGEPVFGIRLHACRRPCRH